MNHELESTTNHEIEQMELHEIMDEVKALRKDLLDLQIKVQPVLDSFIGMDVSRKALMWILIFSGAIGSLILMVKQIFK